MADLTLPPLQASAGRDINIATGTLDGGHVIDRVAGLYVSGGASGSGNMIVAAGRDVSITGAIVSNTAPDGATSLSAGRDLSIGSVVAKATNAVGSDFAKELVSDVQGDKVALMAGNDINIRASGVVAETQLLASAGRDINLVTTTASDSSVRLRDNKTISDSSTVVDKVAGLYVTGTDEGNTLIAQAGRDMTLTAGVIANAGVNGQTSLIAGNNLTLNTVTIASTHDEVRNADNYSKQSKTSEVGSQIIGAGNVNLQAGNNLLARAADVQAGGALGLVAGNDISLLNGFQNEVSDVASKSTKKGFWNKTTTTKHDVVDTTTAIGTSLGGSSVTVQAGHDLQVTGSSILSDDATKLLAGNNITIDAATNTVYELHHSSTKKSGFMSSGGIGFSYGTKTTTVDQERDATLQSGEARSSIGATGGALTMVAGNNVTIGGSDILAATDLDIIGKSVTIKPGQDNEKGKFEVKTTQDGLTLALGGSVISAIQTLQTMSTAASTAKDGRVTAMAAATTAMAAKDAAKDMMKEGGPSISISLTAGHSESIQTQTTASTTHSGSVLTGNNINITAMGGGKDSNINILGSDLNAKNDIRLHADNNVNLLAAQDTESQHSKSSSMSASAGVAASVSTKGMSFGFTASVSGSKGHEDGDGTTQLNTHVNAGDKLVITSGGDTNIKGAVASANQVIADIKGNLNLESLQDTAKFDSKSQSLSVSGTVGFGASVSGSYSQSNMHNDYASVQEQSGIKAGDGGFQIKVGDNTDLKGAVISATEAGKLNSSLTTATLTHSDIVNHAISKGSSVGVSGGMSFAGTGPKNDNLTNVGGEKDAKTAGLPIIVGTSENSSSTTRSGISGGTLVITDDAAQRSATGKGADEAIAGVNRDVTTGVDSSGKIGNNFDKAALQATMEVTKEFIKAAAPLVANWVGDIGAQKQDAAKKELDRNKSLAEEAKRSGNEEEVTRFEKLATQAKENYESWGDNGANRIALHAGTQGLIGALAGGGAGALGSASGVVGGNLGQKLGKELAEKETDRLKLGEVDRQILINSYQQTMASLGGAIGGIVVTGATGQSGTSALANILKGSDSATVVDLYNRQLHDDEKKLIEKKSNGNIEGENRLKKAACYEVKCWAQYPIGSAEYNENYVGAVEVLGLRKESEWVKNKKEDGYFNYSGGEKFIDDLRGEAVPAILNGVKVVTGGLTVSTGYTLCQTTLIGCVPGLPMMGFGAGNIQEGLTGLYKQNNGSGVIGTNFMKDGFNKVSPEWGGVAYSSFDFMFGVAAMQAKVPLTVGKADGLNREKSMFDVKVPMFNNPKLIPITKLPFPNGTNQDVMLFGVGVKGKAIFDEFDKRGGNGVKR